MTDWSKPTTASTYTNYTMELSNRDASLAVGMDSALVSDTNVLTNTVRWNSANKNWERWNGSAWTALTATYGISISGSAPTLTTPRTIDGQSFNGSANITVVAPAIAAATNKATPVGADTLGIWDSVTGLLNKLTLTNIAAWISANVNALTATALAQGTRGYTLTAEQATTSGTSIDFTGIPSWATKIWVMFNGVSTSGTSEVIVQIGPAGAPETSGYRCFSIQIAASTTGVSITNGFGTESTTGNPAAVRDGVSILVLENAAAFRWNFSSTLNASAAGYTFIGAGVKACASALSRVRITTAGGSDTFDAGAIAIAYE